MSLAQPQLRNPKVALIYQRIDDSGFAGIVGATFTPDSSSRLTFRIGLASSMEIQGANWIFDTLSLAQYIGWEPLKNLPCGVLDFRCAEILTASSDLFEMLTLQTILLLSLDMEQDEGLLAQLIAKKQFYDFPVTDEFISGVFSALSDEHASIRSRAIALVGTKKIEQAIPKLLELLQDDTSDPNAYKTTIAKRAAQALYNIGSLEALDALKSLPTDIRENWGIVLE